MKNIEWRKISNYCTWKIWRRSDALNSFSVLESDLHPFLHLSAYLLINDNMRCVRLYVQYRLLLIASTHSLCVCVRKSGNRVPHFPTFFFFGLAVSEMPLLFVRLLLLEKSVSWESSAHRWKKERALATALHGVYKYVCGAECVANHYCIINMKYVNYIAPHYSRRSTKEKYDYKRR